MKSNWVHSESVMYNSNFVLNVITKSNSYGLYYRSLGGDISLKNQNKINFSNIHHNKICANR